MQWGDLLGHQTMTNVLFDKRRLSLHRQAVIHDSYHVFHNFLLLLQKKNKVGKPDRKHGLWFCMIEVVKCTVINIGRKKKHLQHTAPVWWQLTTYKRRVPTFQSASALLPPGPPQQEAQQIEYKHGGLGECAEEGFVVLLSLENVLWEESTGRSG